MLSCLLLAQKHGKLFSSFWVTVKSPSQVGSWHRWYSAVSGEQASIHCGSVGLRWDPLFHLCPEVSGQEQAISACPLLPLRSSCLRPNRRRKHSLWCSKDHRSHPSSGHPTLIREVHAVSECKKKSPVAEECPVHHSKAACLQWRDALCSRRLWFLPRNRAGNYNGG